MTEEELEKYRSFVLAAAGVGSAALLLLSVFPPAATPETKFQVVDQYQDCDVVRYMDASNESNYFLDCRRNK